MLSAKALVRIARIAAIPACVACASVACSNVARFAPTAAGAGANSVDRVALSMARQRYNAIDLGTLGGSFSESSGISNTGIVSGYSATKGDASYRVFTWRQGRMSALRGFGGTVSYSWTINNRNAQSGFSETAKRDPNGEDVNGLGTHLISLPAIWSNDKIATLPLIGGNNGNALGLNDTGEISGWSEINTPDPKCVKPQVLGIVPVIWKDGKVERRLPLAHGDDIGGAIGVNDRGDVIFVSGFCDKGAASVPFNIRHALLWRDGKVVDLGNLGGAFGIEPISLNNRDQVVGQSDLPGDKRYHAFLWDGGIKDLGALPGDCCSVANSISADGTVVGASCHHHGPRAVSHYRPFNCRGFLWKNGKMVDVNSLIASSSPLYVTGLVGGPNASGQMVGVAYTKNLRLERAVLLTP